VLGKPPRTELYLRAEQLQRYRTREPPEQQRPFGLDPAGEDKALLLEGLEAISPVAEEARAMGTTLWFSEQEQQAGKLKTLIATGQFTTCVNLLEYIISLERKKVPFDADGKKRLQDLKKQIVEDLETFKVDPYFLYDKLNP
jgi:hypothetical protein